MTTQIHKCHPRDTEEQLYDVPLHDVELNDVANVRHKSASSCVPSWLHGNLAHYLMLFPRKAYKHKMPAWVWICTLHGCPPHHVVTNLSLSMYHKQPRSKGAEENQLAQGQRGSDLSALDIGPNLWDHEQGDEGGDQEVRGGDRLESPSS